MRLIIISKDLGNEMYQALEHGCSKDNYHYTPKIGCHKIYSDQKNWTAAREVCRQDGADLAIINSEAEAEVRYIYIFV